MGLRCVTTVSHVGSPASGNSAPDRNIIGVMISWTSGIADCTCFTRAASTSPSAVIMNAIRNSNATRASSMSGA